MVPCFALDVFYTAYPVFNFSFTWPSISAHRSAKPRSVSPQDCLRSRGISESSLPIVLRSMWTRPSAQAGLSSLGNTFSMSSELFSVQLARNNPDTISPLSEQISAISRIFSSVEGNGMRGAVFIRGRIPGNTSRPGG